MKLIKTFSIVLCLFVGCAFLLPTAVADQWNQRTYVTFSAPVEVPGTGGQVLPAGTYMFKLMDSTSNRNIVQIFSKDGKHVYTTILAIPNYRLRVTDDTVITFWETPEGTPPAIRAWFYPGENWGQEFVYEKSPAMAVAKVTEEAVVTTPVELAAVPAETVQAAPAPMEEVAQAEPAPQQPQAASEPVQTETPVALPQTASFLPLFGLTGLLSLTAGFALWLSNKRAANRRSPVSGRVN
jgi:hypothetical protein